MRNIKKQGLIDTARWTCCGAFLCVCFLSLGLELRRIPLPVSATEGTAPTTQSTTEPPSETPPAPTDESAGSPIVDVELSLSDGSGNILFKNETNKTFDTQSMLNSGYPIEPSDSDPAVLIIHSHATECYTDQGETHVTNTRTDDPQKNMVAVGAVMESQLRENGVNVIHCTVLHDALSYQQAYVNSAAAVKEYLEKYPSIKYVIDLHRDAISTGDGGMAKPTVTHNGTEAAQMMLVVGTDSAGADHPGWKTNLCVAIHTQAAMIAEGETLMRPINIRSASFNQQLSPGYLLLEIGSCANTLEEAKNSARIFARVFANIVKNGGL